MLPLLVAAVLSASIGFLSWQGWAHPALALLVIAPLAWRQTRRQVFGVALAYYAASTVDLTVAISRFWDFDPITGFAAGVCAWLGWSAVLAATQALPHMKNRNLRPLGVLAGLVLTVIPPVGWFSVVSPLNALGFWFPGTGWWGLLLGGIAILALTFWVVQLTDRTSLGLRHAKAGAAGVWILVLTAITANMLWTRPLTPDGWIAVNTHFGRYRGEQLETLQRAEYISQVVAKHTRDAGTRVIVFPEMAIGQWRPRSAHWLSPAIAETSDSGVAWIAGASYASDNDHPDKNLINGLVVAARGKVKVLPGRIPAPIAMWRPGGYVAHPWTTPVVEIGGQRATISICYEDLLPWAQLQSYWYRPTVQLDLSSLWYASDLSVGRFQGQSLDGWARMFNVPVVRATNH